jgi:ABC-type multidrug transport system fused ATPase/permease subunit
LGGIAYPRGSPSGDARDRRGPGAARRGRRDLDEWPRDVLRAQIGYVEQEAPVLAGTLRDNLLYASPARAKTR